MSEHPTGASEPGFDVMKQQARGLPVADAARHASVSLRNDHRCRQCYTCACLTVLEEAIGADDEAGGEVEMAPRLLIYGNPAFGFTHVYPVVPNDPDTEEFTEVLRDEHWWFVTPVTITEAMERMTGR